LRSVPLTNADFRAANLSESKLLDSLLVNNKFDHATLKNIMRKKIRIVLPK